ncbi:prepilin-type N-terminal cleavage/methylation domain-containing protein [Planctomycetota bacterium]|nr:prepilin-type N-terminal cleavage/methylation domain-containing protein [Planctomycetota bacterium]
MPDQNYKQKQHAFTMIELLVVVGIIGIIAGISFPMLKMMTQTSSGQLGVNTVSVAVQATQAYSFKEDNVPLLNTDLYPNPATQPNLISDDPTTEKGNFSGYAAVFTPSGKIIFMVNDLSASTGVNTFTPRRFTNPALPDHPVVSLELRGPGILPILEYNHTGAAATKNYPTRRLNGFKAISDVSNNSLDPLDLPADTGVCGILKPVAGQKPRLIAPPFAVWYDNGNLVISHEQGSGTDNHGPTDYSYVYVNEARSDGSSTHLNYYDIDVARPTAPQVYNPYVYDSNDSSFNSTTTMNSTTNRPYFPFEKIEAVIGVFTYSKSDFREDCEAGNSGIAGLEDWGVSANSDARNNARWEWMEENGKLVMFSKQSGNPIRSEAK